MAALSHSASVVMAEDLHNISFDNVTLVLTPNAVLSKARQSIHWSSALDLLFGFNTARSLLHL